jgi:hypothetical protein
MRNKYYILLLILFSLSSCEGFMQQVGCFSPSEYDQMQAQQLFNTTYSTRMHIYGDMGSRLFGCHYYPGDEIYYYKTIFRSGYILVRDYIAITYYEESFINGS